jgi:hypothetical protein
MAVRHHAVSTAKQLDEPVSSICPADRRTRLTRSAAAVDFPRCDTRDADLRPFGAPDRSISVPDGHWRTREGLAGRNDLCPSPRLRQQEVRSNDRKRELAKKIHHLPRRSRAPSGRGGRHSHADHGRSAPPRQPRAAAPNRPQPAGRPVGAGARGAVSVRSFTAASFGSTCRCRQSFDGVLSSYPRAPSSVDDLLVGPRSVSAIQCQLGCMVLGLWSISVLSDTNIAFSDAAGPAGVRSPSVD